MKLSKLLSILPFYKTVNVEDDFEIESLETDHRNVKQNDLFVCIKGFTVDGHNFAEKAVANGATAILSEQDIGLSVPIIIVPDTSRALSLIACNFYQFPTTKFPLIGVTGTNGKTTITYLLDAIFRESNKRTGLIGTIQMKIGDQTYPVKNTTPDALSLQKAFRQMVEENVDIAMMEVSSHALDLGRVHGCDFDVAIYTNLTQDHLDYHRDMKEYLHAKTLLFSQLGNIYDTNRTKFAIINQDDPYSEEIKKSTAQHILTYGIDQKAEIMATNIKLDILNTNFTLCTPIGSIEINSRLIGMFNIYNMLAASAAAIANHISLQTIKTALENVKGVDGRFEQVLVGQSYATIVDYAHTPDSLENVLNTIRQFAKNNVYVVIGCGGDRDRTKRPLMAKIAAQHSTTAIFTSDNPRTEDPQSILEEMIEGLEESNYELMVDRKQAIFRAIELAKPRDIVLIAGKGHETYQEINGIKHHFDDREIAKEAILNKEK